MLDRVADDVNQVLGLEGEVGIAPGGQTPTPVGYVQVGLDTVFVFHGRAELAHRIHRDHQRPRKVLQGGVIGGAPHGVLADHRRDRQDHRRWQEAIAPKDVVDQEAREPAIAVTQRVDVDEAEGQGRRSQQRALPTGTLLERTQPLHHLGHHFMVRRQHPLFRECGLDLAAVRAHGARQTADAVIFLALGLDGKAGLALLDGQPVDSTLYRLEPELIHHAVDLRAQWRWISRASLPKVDHWAKGAGAWQVVVDAPTAHLVRRRGGEVLGRGEQIDIVPAGVAHPIQDGASEPLIEEAAAARVCTRGFFQHPFGDGLRSGDFEKAGEKVQLDALMLECKRQVRAQRRIRLVMGWVRLDREAV
ncbi:conserved hypothetical protein [Ricinus communis]|uniref:Uncharacterized protein n=1 Tax=Ricinus communis TaxID=3988 RepID=B9T9Q7_RICCO|nr:conserved hypothetical protein [Ricinus communis]